jgi:hypothetical protein
MRRAASQVSEAGQASMAAAGQAAGELLHAAPPAGAQPTAAKSATPATDRASAPPQPTSAALAAAGLSPETTIDEAAQRLANDLRAIPGIERFGGVRLNDLDQAGPRPLRTMWRVARDRLNDRYGTMTIGEILDRYGHRDAGPGASA